MTTPDLATIVDEQEAEIGRLRADIADTLERAEAAEAEIGRLVLELAVVHRDWRSDVGTLTARAQTAEDEIRALRNALEQKRNEAAQYFQERDAARAEAARLRAALERARALLAEWRDGYDVSMGAYVIDPVMFDDLLAALGGAR